MLLAGKLTAAALPLFDAELRATSNPARKALVALEKARVLDEKLGQKREAREAYEAALELDETNASALRAVERAELSVKAWDALEKTYQRAAQILASRWPSSRGCAGGARALVRIRNATTTPRPSCTRRRSWRPIPARRRPFSR